MTLEMSKNNNSLGEFDLRIIVLQAVHNIKRDIFGQTNPYCKLHINQGEQGQATAIKKKTSTPYWGEEFNFVKIKIPSDTLTIEVYDRNHFVRDVLIGIVHLNLVNLSIPGPDGQMKMENLPIVPPKSKKSIGSLQVKLQFSKIYMSVASSRQISGNVSTAMNAVNQMTTELSETRITTNIRSIDDDNVLPEGWTKQVDQNMRTYYINTSKKQLTLVKPTKTNLHALPNLLETASEHGGDSKFNKRTPLLPPTINMDLPPNMDQDNDDDMIDDNAEDQKDLNIINTQLIGANSEEAYGALIPLPLGWEMRALEDGRMFFVDHIRQQTTWTDPRTGMQPNDITDNQTRQTMLGYMHPTNTSFSTELNSHINEDDSPTPLYRKPYNATSTFASIAPSRSNSDAFVSGISNPLLSTLINPQGPTTAPINQHNTLSSIQSSKQQLAASALTIDGSQGSSAFKNLYYANKIVLGKLPPGWEERRQLDGRIFYVDHIEKRTQYEDPRIQLLLSNEFCMNGFLSNKDSNEFSHVTYKKKLAYFRSKLRQRDGKMDIEVSRENVFEESFKAIMDQHPENLRKRLWVKFKNEPGLDYGGLSREWFFLLSHTMFTPYYGLFEYAANDIYTLQINPNSGVNPEHLQYFEFIGRIVGLAVFHGRLIDAFFITPFYKKILDKKIEFTDIQSMDIEYYNGLKFILDNNIDEIQLDLTFSVNLDKFGEMMEIELIPNGSAIEVCEANKQKYIQLITEWKYSSSIKRQMDAFNTGFYSIVPVNLISIFNEKELELIIGGVAEVDVSDWKLNTEYRNGYHSDHQTIIMFWEVVNEFDNEYRSKLLQFITGTSRVPVNGFKELHGSNGPQKFCIEKYSSVDGLCRAHTCFNRLDLPIYTSKQILMDKLIYAINNTQGFATE